MCIVSGVLDYGRTIPFDNWSVPKFNEYADIIRRLDELDRKLGEPNCERPGKRAWMRGIERRLADLEATKHAHAVGVTTIGGGTYTTTSGTGQ